MKCNWVAVGEDVRWNAVSFFVIPFLCRRSWPVETWIRGSNEAPIDG
jgi:hypothetical protein